MSGLRYLVFELAALLRRFRVEQAGQIAIVFAFASTALFLGVGASIDLARAYTVRQKMSEVAALTCQYARTPSILKLQNTGAGTTAYTAAVTSYLNQSWQGQKIAQSQGTTLPFSAVLNGPSNVQVTATVPTTLMQIAKISTIPVSASQHCYDVPPTPSNNNLITESFENACPDWCKTPPSGQTGVQSQPTMTFPSQPSFQGTGGQQWSIVGYCLETDIVGLIRSSVPDGRHSAELDCDNGSNSAGNSSISTKIYMSAVSYELRYNYAARVDYPNYDPTYICGSTAGDVSWATDTTTGSGGTAKRTNQINVYLDLDTTGAAPLHTTIDNTQRLAGSNLIDVCVYSTSWIERSVRINVNKPGNYWLSFAADGTNDSYGGQIDNIRLCPGSCAGTLNENFPSSWLAANNGGVSKVLFEDTFESPVYGSTDYGWRSRNGNLNSSFGTSGSSSGWPSQTASGWTTARFNQVDYILQSAQQGSQYIALDGANSNGNSVTNRTISRPFLLDPGFYQVGYHYISDETYYFNYSTYCIYTPSSGMIWPLQTLKESNTRFIGPGHTAYGDSDFMGVFLSHGQMVSTPVGGGAFSSGTSYTNPDGSSATYPTTPSVAPDTVNWQNYNASQANPVIDTCASSFNWVTRNVAVKISKPGWYWLTFAATAGTGEPTHTGDGSGPGIDDVTLTALGSPSMSSPPTNPLATIPTPSPASGSTYTNSGQFTGFSIVADPFVMPAQ